ATFRDELLVSYVAGLFRSTRFGAAEAHGKGAALQINRFLEAGALRFDPKTARFKVELDRIEAAIAEVVRDICLVQHRGDRDGAERMLDTYGRVSEPMQQALGNLEGI